jgi:hypothetical protein
MKNKFFNDKNIVVLNESLLCIKTLIDKIKNFSKQYYRVIITLLTNKLSDKKLLGEISEIINRNEYDKKEKTDSDGTGFWARAVGAVADEWCVSAIVDARQLQGNGIEEQQTDGRGEDEAGGECQPAEVGPYAVSA